MKEKLDKETGWKAAQNRSLMEDKEILWLVLRKRGRVGTRVRNEYWIERRGKERRN